MKCDKCPLSYWKEIEIEEGVSYQFGKFTSGEGPVYPEFDPDTHVIEPFIFPPEWQAGISIAPGFHNPTSCHFYAVDGDGVIYIVAEHYEKGRDIDYHTKKIFETADALDWRRDGKGRLSALIDSAANQRTLASNKSVAELFSKKGISVKTCVNKDLYSGVERLKSLFCQIPPRIYI